MASQIFARRFGHDGILIDLMQDKVNGGGNTLDPNPQFERRFGARLGVALNTLSAQIASDTDNLSAPLSQIFGKWLGRGIGTDLDALQDAANGV